MADKITIKEYITLPSGLIKFTYSDGSTLTSNKFGEITEDNRTEDHSKYEVFGYKLAYLVKDTKLEEYPIIDAVYDSGKKELVVTYLDLSTVKVTNEEITEDTRSEEREYSDICIKALLEYGIRIDEETDLFHDEDEEASLEFLIKKREQYLNMMPQELIDRHAKLRADKEARLGTNGVNSMNTKGSMHGVVLDDFDSPLNIDDLVAKDLSDVPMISDEYEMDATTGSYNMVDVYKAAVVDKEMPDTEPEDVSAELPDTKIYDENQDFDMLGAYNKAKQA